MIFIFSTLLFNLEKESTRTFQNPLFIYFKPLSPPKSLSPDFRFGCLSVKTFYWAIMDAFEGVSITFSHPSLRLVNISPRKIIFQHCRLIIGPANWYSDAAFTFLSQFSSKNKTWFSAHKSTG